MKKSLIIMSLLLAVQTANAADWSPVIDGWYGEGFCLNGSTKAEQEIIGSVSVDQTVSGLTKDAKEGRYLKAPLPYRLDMLPAYVQLLPENWESTGYELSSDQKIIIPLKNATYLNIPIKSYAFADRDGYTWYSEFNFGHLSNDQIEQLAKWLDKKEQNDWGVPSLDWNTDGELLLFCHVVNVG